MDLLCHHTVCCSRSWKINSFKETTWIIITHMMCVLSDPHCIIKLISGIYPLQFSRSCDCRLAGTQSRRIMIKRYSQSGYAPRTRNGLCFAFCFWSCRCVFVLARRSKPHHSQPRFASHVCILHNIHLCLRVCLCRKKRQKMRRCSVCTSRDTWDRKMHLAARNGEQLIGFHNRCGEKGVRRSLQQDWIIINKLNVLLRWACKLLGGNACVRGIKWIERAAAHDTILWP